MDEKLIRKHYGEKMWRFCRDNFATILEEPMRMYNLLIDTVYPTHSLYDDLYEDEMFEEFKTFLMTKYNKEKVEKEIDIIDTPEELLKKAGYTLYKCETEEDIQAFKKYYEKHEELCTFKGGRLDTCHVFFAVKDNADKLDRKSFNSPRRQDEYGTSVISIQFTRDESCILSIKNRYNHTVSNPDSTFSNNLDLIIPGLSKSFEKYYGLKSVNREHMEISGYVIAKDEKYYKIVTEANNIYYCIDNIILDNFTPIKKYCDKSRYLFADCFIIDLHAKKIMLYDADLVDDFINVEKDIRKIDVTLEDDIRVVKFYHDDGISILKLSDNNEIISYENDIVKTIGNFFLSESRNIKTIKLKNVTEIGNRFSDANIRLEEIEIPNVQKIGDGFLYGNRELKEISIPNVMSIGQYFLCRNEIIKEISLPKITNIEDGFLWSNKRLKKIDIPNVKIIGCCCLEHNKDMEKLIIPKVKIIGQDFMRENQNLSEIDLPMLIRVDYNFLRSNENLKEISLPSLIYAGVCFMYFNKGLKSIDLPEVIEIDSNFLSSVTNLEKLNIPKTKIILDNFLESNNGIKELHLPVLEEIGRGFMFYNESIKKIDIPNLEKVDDYFLYNNTALEKINAPKLESAGQGFLNNWRITHSHDETDLITDNENVKVLMKNRKK